jgi:hypothetical protein
MQEMSLVEVNLKAEQPKQACAIREHHPKWDRAEKRPARANDKPELVEINYQISVFQNAVEHFF